MPYDQLFKILKNYIPDLESGVIGHVDVNLKNDCIYLHLLDTNIGYETTPFGEKIIRDFGRWFIFCFVRLRGDVASCYHITEDDWVFCKVEYDKFLPLNLRYSDLISKEEVIEYKDFDLQKIVDSL